MNARICDHCGHMWRDDMGNDDVFVQTIYISKGHSSSDKIGDWDLCETCEKGLFDYLKPNLQNNENNN